MAGVTRADWFDGRSARPRPVRLQHAGDALLLLDDGVPDTAESAPPLARLPLAGIDWPERTRHGARVAHLGEQGELHARDPAEWDAFVASIGRRDSWVVRSQQSWRGAAIAALLLLLLAVAGWRWGVPLAADATLAVLPERADREVGAAALERIEGQWVSPSTLPPAQQQALRTAFARAIAAAHGAQQVAWQLEFRASRIGPNAFALPGGTIVLTDELVELVQGEEAVVVGVLAHEYGHLRHRHGMRQAVQAGVLGAVSSLAFGDFSSVLAALPALLGTLAYSRDFEREADDEAIAVLRAAGLPPERMLRFFDAAAEWRRKHGGGAQAGALGIAFSSHPADEERKARFRGAAAVR